MVAVDRVALIRAVARARMRVDVLGLADAELWSLARTFTHAERAAFERELANVGAREVASRRGLC